MLLVNARLVFTLRDVWISFPLECYSDTYQRIRDIHLNNIFKDGVPVRCICTKYGSIKKGDGGIIGFNL